MDQKSKIIARIEEKLSKPSCPVSCLRGNGESGKKTAPLCGEENGDKSAVLGAENDVFGDKSAVFAGENGSSAIKTAASGGLEARLAGVDPLHRAAIEGLLAIERNYPFRAFVTPDGLRAGIVCGPSALQCHWEQFRQFSRLFFGPSHEVICEIFAPELAATARRNNIKSAVVEEVAP